VPQDPLSRETALINDSFTATEIAQGENLDTLVAIMQT